MGREALKFTDPSFVAEQRAHISLETRHQKPKLWQRVGRTGFAGVTLLTSLLPGGNQKENDQQFQVGYDSTCPQYVMDKNIQYNGVPSIPRANIFNVFLNWDWNKDPWFEFDLFTLDLAEGGGLDDLKQLGVDGANFMGSAQINTDFTPIKPSEWGDYAKGLIEKYYLPKPSQDMVYNFFLPLQMKNAVLPCFDGRSSFHSSKDDQIFFTVIVANGADRQWIEGFESHEIKETITDRIYKKGWSAVNGTEIDDICGVSDNFEDGKYQNSEDYINGQCVSGAFRGRQHSVSR